MLNSKERKEAKKDLQEAVDSQKVVADQLKENMEYLYHTRQKLKERIQEAMVYINSLKNVPENLNVKIEKIQVNVSRYEGLLKQADVEYAKVKKQAGGTAAAGVGAGIGVATLAPTAAMAVATTFGTAATGTAIASLSGAAATNAALAWLGGGALVTGGAGIAGGETLLALAGPVGWAIGGAALLTGGAMANGKNKKAAAEMKAQTIKVYAAERTQQALTTEIKRMDSLTEDDLVDIRSRIMMAQAYPLDFHEMTEAQISLLGTLVNNVHSAAKRLNSTLGENGKFTD
ncbi:MAG TPA: hypothetical protein H9875_07465 [Candidatus Levilactobacillus faecigallinarum]|uniref:Uncharacterized protein n=1 Tax=Candidatus Levilactobacillus faecigallinarum TaxID=2838638 RepID=A0A9D1QUM3_9LACO|nr:hypothetical protein [Candidatus Levilactobacillus faecigallinarum]